MFGATDRTVRRWLTVYLRNPDIVALLSRQKGQRMSNRRLKPDSERLLGEVIGVWAARAERLPVSWIVEECRRRARSRRVEAPGRRGVDARLRDRGLDSLTQQRFAVLEPDRAWQVSKRGARHAGYLALLPLKKAAVEIDKRFVEYLLELSDGVTGRIIEVFRRAAFQAIADKSQKVGLQQLQYVGARMSSVIGRRS